MNIIFAFVGWSLILWTLLDAFEQVILPRTESRVFRTSSLALRFTWVPWKILARRINSAERRAAFLAYYGPFSVLILLATWDLSLILGFSMGWWAVREGSFAARIYVSGSNFFALGLSSPPVTDIARLTTLIEAGLGLGLLAVIIGYLPVYYGIYSNRETFIIRFQSVAGYPSAGLNIVRRFAPLDQSMLLQFIMECQAWAAHILQSQRSYPLVSLYRSQKGNESWLTVLTVILDACALWTTAPQNKQQLGSQQAFEVAFRAAMDLAGAFRLKPMSPPTDRLPRIDFEKLFQAIADAGIEVGPLEETERKLTEYRGVYEPYIYALSEYLYMELPSWMNREDTNSVSPGVRAT
jgi:hypothetical protein